MQHSILCPPSGVVTAREEYIIINVPGVLNRMGYGKCGGMSRFQKYFSYSYIFVVLKYVEIVPVQEVSGVIHVPGLLISTNKFIILSFLHIEAGGGGAEGGGGGGRCTHSFITNVLGIKTLISLFSLIDIYS